MCSIALENNKYQSQLSAKCQSCAQDAGPSHIHVMLFSISTWLIVLLIVHSQTQLQIKFTLRSNHLVIYSTEI